MSDNLKWLLLIPVVIVAVVLGFLIPKLVGGGSDERTTTGQQQNQALQVDIDDTKESIQGYEGLLNRNPGDPDALRGLADRYRELGSLQNENNQENESLVSYKTAIDYYRQYLAAGSADQSVRIDLGLTYFYLQMPEIAEREIRTVTQALPGNQRGWHSLGWVLEKGLGKQAEAQAAWQTSYQIDPNSPVGQESKQFLDGLAAPQ